MIRKVITTAVAITLIGGVVYASSPTKKPANFSKLGKAKTKVTQPAGPTETQVWNNILYYQKLLKLNSYERRELTQELQKWRSELDKIAAQKEAKKGAK